LREGDIPVYEKVGKGVGGIHLTYHVYLLSSQPETLNDCDGTSAPLSSAAWVRTSSRLVSHLILLEPEASRYSSARF
jgi:hypothetical protein